MNRFFSARLRKSLADVTRRKWRTLLVTLGIFIGVFGLTVINSVEDTLINAFAYTRGYQATQPDFQMTVDRLDPALPPTLRGLPGYAGGSLVGDGRMALILDVDALLETGLGR